MFVSYIYPLKWLFCDVSTSQTWYKGETFVPKPNIPKDTNFKIIAASFFTISSLSIFHENTYQNYLILSKYSILSINFVDIQFKSCMLINQTIMLFLLFPISIFDYFTDSNYFKYFDHVFFLSEFSRLVKPIPYLTYFWFNENFRLPKLVSFKFYRLFIEYKTMHLLPFQCPFQ